MANVETLEGLERRVSMTLPANDIERPQVSVDDAAVEKTIGILRKQRTRFVSVARAAKEGDRLTVDFDGTIDGQPFAGGKAENFVFAVGEGRMLPEFDAAARGMSEGESKSFELGFPEDYHGKEVAGKRAAVPPPGGKGRGGQGPPAPRRTPD